MYIYRKKNYKINKKSAGHGTKNLSPGPEGLIDYRKGLARKRRSIEKMVTGK